MSEKKLTIAVPAYNIEKYLSVLLDSLVEDRNILNDLQIIVVNDGSTDRTSEIAHKYEGEYPGSVIVVDKENAGHGSGINVGIKLATGKYFKVIDSDDWVNSVGLRELIDAIDNDESDVFVNPYKMVWEDGTQRTIDYSLLCKNCELSWDAINEHGYRIPLHAFTIKTAILKKQNRLIDEKIFYDDIEFVLFPVPYIKKIVILNEVLYCYRLGRPGQSVAINSYVKNIKHFEKMLDSIAEYYKDVLSNLDDAMKQYYLQMTYDMISKICDIYLYIGDNQAKRNVKDIFKKYEFLEIKRIKSRKVNALRVACNLTFGILSFRTKRLMRK